MPEGFVTSARAFPSGLIHSLPWSSYGPDYGYGHESGTMNIPGLDDGSSQGEYQETYSFRTGRFTELSEGTPDDPLADLPSTEAGVYRYLVEQDQGDPYAFFTPYDKGHVFKSLATQLTDVSGINEYNSPSATPHSFYQGPVLPSSGSSGDASLVPPVVPDEFANFSYYGKLGIARTVPDSPSAALADDLGQLLTHSFFPSLEGLQGTTKEKFVKYLSDSFVNYQFGWKPFQSEFENLVRSVALASKLAKVYGEGASSVARRRADLDNMVGETSITHTAHRPIINGNFCGLMYPSTYPVTIYDTTKTRVWFSGAYVSYAPIGPSRQGLIDRAETIDKHLGGELSVDDLWDLQPWSWLADWRFDISDTIGNAEKLSNADLVLAYGYVMCTQTCTRTVVLEPLYTDSPTGYTWTSTRKERIQATPYGFGADSSSWDTTQWAILAALGISKAWKVFA